MITIHNLILSYLAESDKHMVSDVRGVRLSYANGKTNSVGKPAYDNLPLDGTRTEQIEFLYKSHINSLEYFARSKDETTKQSAQSDLLLIHKQYSPFIKVSPYKGTLVTQDETPSGTMASVEDLAKLLANGTMTLEQFTIAVKAMNSTPTPTKEKVVKFDAGKPITANSDLPTIKAKAIKGGYAITNANYNALKLGVINFDETFSAVLKDENGKFLAQGKFIITTIRKTDFSVKTYIP